MLKLAWFSILSQSSFSKSAHFTAQLKEYLERNYCIDYFIDQDTEANNTYHYLRALQLNEKSPYDCFVYQVEDASPATFSQQHLSLFPGITIFHDLNLNSLYYSKHSHETSATVINAEMDSFFGEASARIGDYFVKGWPIGIFDNIYIRSESEIRDCSFPVVFNSYQQEYLFRKTNRDSLKLPFVSFPLNCKELLQDKRSKLREQYQLTDSDFVISFSSGLEIKDRFLNLLDLLNESPQSGTANLVLAIISNKQGEINKFKNIVAERLRNNTKSVYLETIDYEEYFEAHLVSDLHFALNNDLLRGMPLNVNFCLSNMVATVTSRISWAREIPENCAFKINIGFNEFREFNLLLKELKINPLLLEAVKQNARSYIEQNHFAKIVFQDLQRIIESNSFQLKNLAQQRLKLLQQTRQLLLNRNQIGI